jgi:hypothetical protein
VQRATPSSTQAGSAGAGGPPGKPPLPPQEDEFKAFLGAQGKKITGYRTTTAALQAAGFNNIGGSWLRAQAPGQGRAHVWGLPDGSGHYLVQGVTFGEHDADNRTTSRYGDLSFGVLMVIFRL